MKSDQNKKKTVAKKAATGHIASGGKKKATSAKKTTYKPGSLLARNGGMVPTVELSKRAAKKIS